MTNSSTTPAAKPHRLNRAVRMRKSIRKSLNAYPSSKLGWVKFATATKAMYSITSGTNRPAVIANSPSSSAPTIPNALLSAPGVLREASFTPSIMISMTSNCMIMGTVFGSLIRTNSSQGGIISGFCMSRYQMGVKNRVRKNTIPRTKRR